MKEIETERLILRNFTESDFEDLFEYISDPAVTEYEPYKPMNKQEAFFIRIFAECDPKNQGSMFIANCLTARWIINLRMKLSRWMKI